MTTTMAAASTLPGTPGAGAPSRSRSVTFIRFVLRFTEPGAVTVPGTPDRDASWGRGRAHLVLDTDPWDRPHLPGTSLAGALREMVRAADGADAADVLFGRLLPKGTGGTEVDTQASLIWVLGSRAVDVAGNDLADVPSEVRASTAVSRRRGAAEANTLRVEEVLPAGSRFEVFLRWDDAPAEGRDRLLELLAAWRPLIGHGISRGRGRCETMDVRHGTLRLDEPAGLLWWLTLSGTGLARAVATTVVRSASPAGGPVPVLRVPLRITGPLRVGSGEPPEQDGDGPMVALMFRRGGRYVIPGTGIKGLLRARAEYILRSVGVAPLPCLDQRCGRCWPCEVFGFGGGHDVTSQAVGARALIRVVDAVVDEGAPVRRRQHVAIDRFTGGAQEGLLYTVEALEGGQFTLEVEPLAADLPSGRLAQIRAVLRLVLEDLDDGQIGVGAGVTRGYGSVSVGFAAVQAPGDLPSSQGAREELARMQAMGRTGLAAEQPAGLYATSAAEGL
jgi:CRISPR/Cas system CSM-associated protein Csm3 (group 7 of RAMP superfamily)